VAFKNRLLDRAFFPARAWFDSRVLWRHFMIQEPMKIDAASWPVFIGR